MKRLLKIDRLIRKYLEKLYSEMNREIIGYIQNKIPFKKLTKGSQQILRTLGIYYEKTLPPDWKKPSRKKYKRKNR